MDNGHGHRTLNVFDSESNVNGEANSKISNRYLNNRIKIRP